MYMQGSQRLLLPYIQGAQAQKHVTHNEALERLDLAVQAAVEATGAETPPADPVPGQCWALGATPTDAWADEPRTIAMSAIGGGWLFVAPSEGWRVWDRATGRLLVWTGAEWAPAMGELRNLEGVGIGAAWDATNRLAVASDATLLTHAGADHRLKVNKAGPADTASLLFQSGWSGRAEMGLVGSDAFSVKVSADGATFAEAMRCGADGRVTVPALRSAAVTVADGAVAGVPLTGPGLVALASDDAGHAALAAVVPGAGLTLLAGGSVEGHGTAALNGTVSGAGTTGLAATATGLGIENRSGAARSYVVTLISA